MKQQFIRTLSVVLAVVLLFGLMPTVAFAGGGYTAIEEARVFVAYPMGSGHPNMEAQIVGTANYTVDFVHFFNCYNGAPTGGFLPESHTYVAGRYYACQLHLVPKSDYAFDDSSEVRINGRYPEDRQIESDGSAYFMVYFYAAAGTVTVTFDNNGQGAPHAPVEVPRGGSLADAVADVSELDPAGVAYKRFIMWSENPFASTNSYDAFSYTDPVDQDTTIYAVWVRCEQSVELCVELPAACLTEDDCSDPRVTVPERASYSVTGDHLYLPDEGGAPDFHSPGILDFSWPYAVERGKTYYSRAVVYLSLGAKLPAVQIYGGQLVSRTKLSDYELEVIYSVTIPNGNSLTKAGVYIETPKAGQSVNPVVRSLSPGLEMSVWGWYTNQNLSGDWYEGTLEGGKTYYALVRINGGINYNIASSTLNLDVFGKNAELKRMVDLAGSEGVPNLVGAVVAVTIPRTYSFTVEVPYGGGKFRSDRHGDSWTTIMDFSGVEEGPITLEALADPEHMFSMWYDANTFDTLSRAEKYTFNLNRDVRIKASFVRKTPFVDVRAKDYFYEPVLWAVEHDPIITSGVDATHFGPKKECSRAQIVTFLWKALYEPEYDPIPNPFSDVKPGKYYYDAVLWAYSNGITSGVGGGKFGVNQGCTRAQAMFFLWKSYGSPAPESANCPFKDVKPGKYYYDAILWAYENGVTAGLDEHTFGVNKTCTRAQIITFLYKVYGPKG